MLKKLIICVAAVFIMVCNNAGAAVSKETCNKSDKTIWVDGVVNPDGGHGTCVVKNACTSDAFRKRFCNTEFANIQVDSAEKAKSLIGLYLITHYGENCKYEYVFMDVDNIVGQDYIGVMVNSKQYVVFEFDDTNETIHDTGFDGWAHGLCIAIGGKYQGINNYGNYECLDVEETYCRGIHGDYLAPDKRCTYLHKI